MFGRCRVQRRAQGLKIEANRAVILYGSTEHECVYVGLGRAILPGRGVIRPSVDAKSSKRKAGQEQLRSGATQQVQDCTTNGIDPRRKFRNVPSNPRRGYRREADICLFGGAPSCILRALRAALRKDAKKGPNNPLRCEMKKIICVRRGVRVVEGARLESV